MLDGVVVDSHSMFEPRERLDYWGIRTVPISDS